MQWSKDAFGEGKLQAFGCKWTEQEIKLDDIDWEESRTNCARLSEPIDADTVDEYAVQMKRGDAFPMIIVLKRKAAASKYVVISGNHRGLAAKTLSKTVPAYVVSSDDSVVWDLLPRIFNRGHGIRQGREEAMQHAVHAVQNYGYKPHEAEQMFGLRAGTVAEEIRIRDARSTLLKQGVKAQELNKACMKRLSILRRNENVQAAAAQVMVKAKMKEDDADAFVKAIQRGTTEAAQMAVVADYENRLRLPSDPGPVVKHAASLRSKFLRWLTTGEKYVENRTSLNQLQITSSEEKAAIAARLRTLAGQVRALYDSVGPQRNTKSSRRSA